MTAGIQGKSIEIARSGYASATTIEGADKATLLDNATVVHREKGRGVIKKVKPRPEKGLSALLTVDFANCPGYLTTVERLFVGNFEVYPAADVVWMLIDPEAKRTLVESRLQAHVLALDIEANRETIWKIGVFLEGRREILFPKSGDPEMDIRRALGRPRCPGRIQFVHRPVRSLGRQQSAGNTYHLRTEFRKALFGYRCGAASRRWALLPKSFEGIEQLHGDRGFKTRPAGDPSRGALEG